MELYTKQWSTATPGYLIFLVDQSSSMATEWLDKKSFAVFTSEVINQTINELIATNAAGETVKDRVFISIIGYGGNNEIKNLRSDYLSKYADSPIRIDKNKKKVSDGDGGYVDMEIEIPIFLEPRATGLTPMAGAFELAKKIIIGWIEKKNDNPVPIIMHISDGHPEGSTPALTNLEETNTKKLAKEILSLRTEDGNPLIFNVHIAKSGKEYQFPESKLELDNDKMAEFLFDISSEVPASYRKAAKDLKLQGLKNNSKGFISNASPETLIKFINFGSSGGTDRTAV
jgi:uncharacterized protein YegL